MSAAAFGAPLMSLVVKVGDPVGATTVSSVNSPFTNDLGQVGLVVNLADGARAIWLDSGPIFNSASVSGVTGSESTMGISNAGDFIYSPSVNGNDAVYTNGGSLLKGTDPVPPLPGFFSTFNSRPTMTAAGTSYWMGGISATSGGSTTNRVFFKATNPLNPASITKVFQGGDTISGFTLNTTSSNFDYDVSDNDAHHIHVVDTTAAAASNTFIYLDGALTTREGTAVGDGTNWLTFDMPSINNAGNYLFSGTTSGATTSDGFLAYNSAIGIREGMTVGGVTLATGAAVRAASINNLNQAAYIWGWGSGSGLNELLYVSSDASNLLSSATMLLRVGDQIDVTGDSVADWQVFDFKASGTIGPGLDFGENNTVFVELGLGPIGGAETFEAIAKIVIPEPATIVLLGAAVLGLRRRR